MSDRERGGVELPGQNDEPVLLPQTAVGHVRAVGVVGHLARRGVEGPDLEHARTVVVFVFGKTQTVPVEAVSAVEFHV